MTTYEDKSFGKGSKSKSINHGQCQGATPISSCNDIQPIDHNDDNCGNNKNNGELFLLYRYLKKYKIYHAINGKTSGTSRKKGIKIPQDFTGEFFE